MHESAQEEIAQWLVDRSSEGALILSASHSAAFLDLPAASASLVGVVRSESKTQLYDLTADTLDSIDDLAVVLGVGRRARPSARARSSSSKGNMICSSCDTSIGVSSQKNESSCCRFAGRRT